VTLGIKRTVVAKQRKQ